MVTDILLLVLGLVFVVIGADVLVDGASFVARKAGISEFVIGLTIVGFGTSCPELVVSLTGAIAGNADISIGNVVGSNIMNSMLILGLTALLAPVAVTRQNSHRDIPIAVLVTFMFVLCGMSQTLLGIGGADGISRVEGIVFLVVFAIYLYYCFKNDSVTEDGESEDGRVKNLLSAVLFIIIGLAGLIGGGQLFVNHSVGFARAVGVSDKFIAVTLLAGGTSLPELATCIVAAAKKKDQLALGNILGSNVFNILLILGCSATVTPLSFAGMNLVDMTVLLLSVILLWIFTYTGRRDTIDRWEGALLLLCSIGYLVWLTINL